MIPRVQEENPLVKLFFGLFPLFLSVGGATASGGHCTLRAPDPLPGEGSGTNGAGAAPRADPDLPASAQTRPRRPRSDLAPAPAASVRQTFRAPASCIKPRSRFDPRPIP